MNTLLKIYTDTAPGAFWTEVRQRGTIAWHRLGAPAGRRAEFEARMERKLRARLVHARALALDATLNAA